MARYTLFKVMALLRLKKGDCRRGLMQEPASQRHSSSTDTKTE
jgi:hypothetical protein